MIVERGSESDSDPDREDEIKATLKIQMVSHRWNLISRRGDWIFPTGSSPKWSTREHCDYTLKELRKTAPLALATVGRSIWEFFNRSVRIIGARRDGLRYGCEELKDRVYKAHRRIESSAKW